MKLSSFLAVWINGVVDKWINYPRITLHTYIEAVVDFFTAEL